jgi:hypothetical protein
MLEAPLKVHVDDELNEVRFYDPTTGEVVLRSVGTTPLNAIHKLLQLTKTVLKERKEIEHESRRIPQ